MGTGNPFVVDRKPRLYAGTFNGQFEFKASPETPNATSRVNKNGKTVWFTTAKSLIGRIVDVDKRETEYGPNLEITLEKNGVELVFSTPWQGNVAAAFFNRMENIDYTAEVMFEVSSKDKRQTLFIKQGFTSDGRGGKNILSKYTMENPNGRPDWARIETGSGVVFDKSEQFSFFENILETIIRPHLHGNAGTTDNAGTSGANATAALLDVGDDDFVITAPQDTASMFATSGTPADGGDDDDLPF